MELLQQHLPGKRTVIPYYVTAALSLVIISFLTFISLSDFKGHFFQPSILAITHLTVFGWATMIILGASNQLMPVIADNKLYSDRIPVVSFVFLLLGACLLVHSFWYFELGAMMFTGAFFILTALILHSVNILLTLKKVQNTNIVVDFILTAHLWLIVTALIGITLLFNFRLALLPADHLHYLKIHASTGMAGWFLLLVIGVSSRLVPMFLLSRKEVKKYLTIAYYFINAGLVLLLIEGMILHSSKGLLVYVALIAIGVIFYVAYIWNCYKSAIRKKLDAGMKQTIIALGAISLPFILLAASVLYLHAAPVSLISAYGYSFFGGFITTLILGQTFKTLPFIVWMHLAKPNMLAELQPKDLYKEHLVTWQMALYLPGFLLFLMGILLRSTLLMYPGSIIMIAASILYCGHVLYVVNKLRK